MPKRSIRARLLPGLAGVVRHVPPSVALASRPLLAAAASAVPGWRAQVRRSMTAALGADGVPEHAVRDYFRRMADQMAFSMVIYRSGMHAPPVKQEWIWEEAAQELYVGARAQGKGVLFVATHLFGIDITAGVVARSYPVAVLARKAPEPEYEAVKQRWYGQLGLEVILRKPGESSLGLRAAFRLLRENGTLAIAPDLLRKPGTGVAVSLFGRTADLPPGPFQLAQRTGAAFLPSFFHREGDAYRLWVHPPLPIETGGDRDAAVADAAQRWACLFEAFLREHPEMWQFWLDKRWVAWLRGDARSD